MKKKLALAGALVLALGVSACTDAEKCLGAKVAYEAFVKSDRGGADEKKAALAAYEYAKRRCALIGVVI